MPVAEEESELEPDPEMNVKSMTVSEPVWLANGGIRSKRTLVVGKEGPEELAELSILPDIVQRFQINILHVQV